MAEQQPAAENSISTTYVGLEGQNVGYDQPADPPSYTYVTKSSASIPTTHTANTGPPTYPAQTAYPGIAPGLNVTQQPVSINNVIVSQPATIVVQHVSYLGFSIFTCLFCCLPLGFFAILYSYASRDDAMYGRLPQARKNARVALRLNVASVVIGIAFYITIILAQVKKEEENSYYD